jgi:hypothetical protein
VYWKIQIAALMAASLLAGCGGGDKESTPAESTGVLHAKIQGVTYRTASRSGKTDANGSFKYLPGESVTFSVGGIELGSAAGASNISLFTLAGMTPPTSELGLRRELNRMRYTATPLSNAANRAWLLLALDADGNPADGIDVSSFESALATAKLSFDFQLYEFRGKMSRLAPGMNNNIPESFPLEWLYRSLGVKMAGNVPVRSTSDDQDDGVLDSVAWNEVDAAGDVVATFIDQDIDGAPDVTVSYERDVLGRVTRERTVRDFNLDRTPDSDHTVVTSYDAHGNILRVQESEDGNADGSIDADSTSEWTFDSYGRELTSSSRFDNDHDGTVDATETHTFSRDARGNLLRELTEVDQDANGQPDGRYTTDNTWDAADRQLSSLFQRDLDADGQVDNARRWSATYGASGGAQDYAEDYDGDGDGVYEQQLRAQYGYDPAGNVTSSVADYEDAWSKYRITSANTYDRDRRPLSWNSSYDFDLDGTADSSNRQTHTYDSNGFELAWEYANDYFTTGTSGWLDKATYAYTPEGAQQTWVYGTDFDSDGVTELSRRSVIEYAPSNDAMVQIVGQYLGGF